MMEYLLRFGAFIGIFLLMALWEYLRPFRHPVQTRMQRWSVNLSLAVLNQAILRVSIGAATWLAAGWSADHKLGLFNFLSVPNWLAIVTSLILLDMAIYAQHVASHRWCWFWRLHQVHHSDLDFDITTALRFHPFEILLSMIYKVGLVIILGAQPVVVIVFETILNGFALFNHSNITFPPRVERIVRWFMVTPDMHRIHHSARLVETNSNYGFSLSCWDRWFNTYCPEPKVPQASMLIGLQDFQNASELNLIGLLLMPFHALFRKWPN